MSARSGDDHDMDASVEMRIPMTECRPQQIQKRSRDDHAWRRERETQLPQSGQRLRADEEGHGRPWLLSDFEEIIKKYIKDKDQR